MFLALLILFPLIGAVLLGLRPRLDAAMSGRFALSWSTLTLLGALMPGIRGGSWSLDWLGDPLWVIHFHCGGISFLFVLLSCVVVLVSLISSLQLKCGDRSYFALILILQSALIGVFTARHFIPWFLFWEMTLIPAYLLIRMWGSKSAPQAALRFFIMTLGGSAFMLVGFLVLQFVVGTMDFDALALLARAGALESAMDASFPAIGICGSAMLMVVAVAVFLGFAVKLPVVPFHAWLPAAYAEAPTPVTMLLTGVLSKMGLYGLLTIFLPVFSGVLPMLAPWLAVLAVLTVLLGAMAALAQRELKRILAYSSVNHLGYCALAVAALAAGKDDVQASSSALTGAVLQGINHGLIACGLFYGIVILQLRGNPRPALGDFGGLRARMPVYCGCFGLMIFATLGLPGLSGFIGEFLIFHGSFAMLPGATVLAVPGLLLTAVFLLRMIRKVFHGPLPPALATWQELSRGERTVFGILILLVVVPGVLPQVLTQFINADVIYLIDLFTSLS